MKILFCTSEAVPFAKTGGLADISGALPAALVEHGCDVHMALPRYGSIPLRSLPVAGMVQVPLAGKEVSTTIYQARLPEAPVPVWLVDAPQWFDRPGLYGEDGRDYPDNLQRFTIFCRAVLAWLRQRASWQPDVVHCNDWQTALLPVLLRTDAALEAPPTVFTIHNLAYQGLSGAEQWDLLGLPHSLFTPAGLEFWGKINLLKGGLVFSDVLNTVSETYAREIQTEQFGAGLDGVLRLRRDDLFGILNGVDYRVWDPFRDRFLPANYTDEDLSGKRVCKEHLQGELGLTVDPDVPVIGMITRLVEQKGIDLVIKVIAEAFGLGAQLALLGTGEPTYHRTFEELARRFPRQAGIKLGFDDGLAHRIEAGADIFLMPSRYEPGGLNQLYSLRYGTVPIVRRTGGLADSIVDLTPETQERGTANGFVFVEPTPAALFGAMRRALAVFRDNKVWRLLQLVGMRQDFSWSASAAKYRQLYERARSRHAARASV